MLALHSTDNRVSASLAALGFVGNLRTTIHAEKREYVHEVTFDSPSTRFPQLDPRLIVQQWKASRCMRPLMNGAEELLPARPMHAFACAMRAQESYDAFLQAVKTGEIPFLTVDDSLLFYRYNSKRRAAFQAEVCEPCDDMSLAAACGPLGIPLVTISGPHGSRRFHLRALGEPVKDALGATIRHVTADLLRRSPTREDPLRLALEVTQPLHPLCIGYDALHARADLKKKIQQSEAALLITTGDGTGKQALVSLNYAGHVGRAVERHFGSAPGALR